MKDHKLKQTIFIAHVGVGDNEIITRAAMESALKRNNNVFIAGAGSIGKSHSTMKLFPTIQGDKMIEASITLESNIDINKLLIGDKFNHSVGIKIIKEDE